MGHNPGIMDFASRIIAWQRAHGRHGLPWQDTRDPYRIWLSEIMLQQTQVATVIPYYHRFLERFPDVAALAAAPQETVMALWAGLGYYARARNLHRCAQAVAAEWDGQFPPDAGRIASLPGIGRSTAAAIAAFAYGERSAILDGNVKRVFARHFGIEGDPARRDTEQAMWALAEAQVGDIAPADMPAYTQGLMDLGATLCTRGKPDCGRCPLAATCVARRDGRQQELPSPRVRKARPERETAMLVVECDGRVLLELRPEPGIWGGLWSLPEFTPGQDPREACRQLGATPETVCPLAPFAHAFTHYRLHVQPFLVRARPRSMADGLPARAWTGVDALADTGLPAPVRKLLEGLYAPGGPGLLFGDGA